MRRAPLVFLLVSACTAGKAVYAPAGDYADYRRVRVAETLDERVAAASDYLAVRPDGVYADEVRAFLARAEAAFFAAEKGTAAGLERYLAALPHGAYATEALDALMHQRVDARQAQAGLELTQKRLDEERDRRARASRHAFAWVDGLLDPEPWRRPFADAARDELVVAWAVPAPACRSEWGSTDLRHCERRTQRSYAVTVAGELVARAIELRIELSFDVVGRLRGARLFGPALFARLAEADTNVAYADDDRAAAARVVAAKLSELLTAHGCAPEASPLDADVRCGPLLVRAFGRDAGDDELTLSFDES